MEQNKLEILLEAKIGNEKPSLETIIEVLAQFSTCSYTMSNHYTKKMEGPVTNFDTIIDNVIGFSSWNFLSKILAVTGMALCQKTPDAIIELTGLMDDFAKKWSCDVQKSKNKKEETFFKENININ